MKNFKEKNYKILIGIMVLIIGIIGINKLESYDLNKGKVHLSKAVIENKLNASVIEAKGYEEITYPIFYTLEKVEGIEKRNVVIKASLTKDENKYAKFKEIKSENITSTLTENGSKIEIRLENVELGKEEKLELKLQLTGAPNGYKINPKVEIKEETEEKYTKIEAKEIEVKTNSITGIIKDEEGMSVSNIEISINKEGQEIKKAVTNEEGRYVFSDIEEGRYELKIEEEIYELENKEEIEVKEGIVKDIKVKKVRPYKIEVSKYIEKVKINNKEYTYENLNRVNQSIKNAKEITGEIEYKVVVKNTGTKEGIITKVEEEKIEGLKFNKEKNKGWEEKEGKIYNNSLEGLTIKAGEEKEIKLILDIEKTEEAKSYLTRVTVKGEVYEKVSYILDNKIYKEEEVLEGEKIEEEKLEIEGFSGWYTDKNYTNKYNYEKGVTKDLILYGKTEEAVKKYTVTYIDEGKIIKKEELEEGSIISAPEVTKEGHTFIGWYEKENKYDVYEPITRDLILESKYEINKYKITFKNYDGSVLEENETKYKEKPVYKGETPKREKDEEYSYIFDGWDKELEEATKEEEYTAVYKKEKNKYTVTYINEGIEYHKETLEYGSVITDVQDPIKEGYTFIGWYTKNNEKVNHPITVTKNITLYSKYEINVYTVSFYHNNEKYVEDQKVNYGENAIKPSADPSKIGYTFKYWSLEENGEKYEFSTKITKDITLYAVYEINNYTVTYINEGTEYHKETLEYGSVITNVQDPIKEGYTFTGWYNENNEKVNHPITVTKNITLYSKYEINVYTVSFYHNNEKYVEDQKVNYGENAIKPSTDPTKEDYNFSGWVIKGTNNKYDFTSKVTKDIELESSFTKKPTYTVTFKIGNEVILTENVIEGHKVTSKEAPYKKGYLFDKWYSDEGLTIENNFDEKIMGNKTIYGKYNENKHTVTYINEGTTYYTEEVLDSFTAKGPSVNPEKEGYTFKYFSKDKKVAFDYNIEITEDITLYAVYEINTYTVTYINEGSEYHKEELTYKSEHEKIEDPFKTGYTFIGWYNENEEKVEYPIIVTKDITLHSKYEINKYKVSFYNEGVKYIEDESINYKEKAVKPSVNPEKEGYTFKYWSTKENGEEYNFNAEIMEDITLYAVYEINTYKVVFKNYDGSVLQEETLDYGSTPVYKKDVPTREKTEEYTYEFKSWDKEITNVTSNQEYIATYKETKNQYKIIFTNYDGSVLQEETLDYGSEVTYKGNIPTREKTKEYTYTFTGWDKEITKVLKNETYIAVYKEEKNKYTVTFMDEERIYGKKEVEYNSVVTDTENHPSKAHYIFKGWTLNDEIYDFNSPVTEDITLKSLYEKVEEPVITHTPTEWTKNNVTVSITSDHSDYKYLYKIDNGEYKEYTGEFTVSENCVVVAKSVKENVESEVTTHEITNIDKIAPTINEVQEENVTVNSFDIKVKAIDNESGLKEVRIYKNEELMISRTYESKLNEEKDEIYSMTGLEENTTYKIKIELIDKVGNISETEEKEVTTLKRIIKARIIGRNNNLYETEEEYELFESLNEAIESCETNQCTIEMVLDTKESVEVLEGQDITLNVNDKIITGERDYTIENSGILKILDKAEETGKIINETGIGIKNINNGELQLGENEEELEVSIVKPNVVGTTYGIYTEGENTTFKFYDGKIEGNVAIQGEVNDTPYLYNAGITSTDHQIATLTILADAEAKIEGGKYYTKLSSALGETESGRIEETEATGTIMDNVITPSRFGFVKANNKLVSNTRGMANVDANSYIKLDLTNYENDQLITVNAEISSYKNKQYGYITVTESKDIPEYNQTEGRMVYISGSEETKDYTMVLKKGKVYYLHIGYKKNVNYNYTTGTDTFTINDISLRDYIVSDMDYSAMTTPSTYGFIYDEETKTLKNNNQGKNSTVANSYLVYDMTNEIEDRELLINAEISSRSGYHFGYVTVTNTSDVPAYNNSENRYIYISGDIEAKDYKIILKAGQINYIHFGYRKDGNSARGTDTFTINSISNVEKGTQNINYNGTKENILLNEKVDKVELLKDITLSDSLVVDKEKDVILDLRGKTLSISTSDYIIKNNGNLKIIDSKYDDDISEAQRKYEEEQASYDQEYNEAITRKEEAESKYQKELKEYNENQTVFEYDYTGEEQTFIAPKSGYYKLETWGAQGGSHNSTYYGGYGGYSSGTIYLNKDETIYINVGGQPLNDIGGYNGGGSINTDSYNANYGYAGGGATHIAKKSGLLYTLEDDKNSIIIVSGGGGGANHRGENYGEGNGGSAGGYIGSNGQSVNHSNGYGYGYGLGGTQESGGSHNWVAGTSTSGSVENGLFGRAAIKTSSSYIQSGGGGGYYGGGNGGHGGAGGGSSYIENENLTNKFMYCYNCEESNEDDIKTISTTNISEKAISNYAKEGNGYAKISLQTDNDGNTSIPKEKPKKPTNGYTTDDYIKDDLKLQLDGLTNTSLNTWKDLSGNNINGTINGSIYQDNGYYFDGSNDYISVGEINSDNVTIEATITPQISDNNEREIISNYETGGYGILLQDGYIRTTIYINGTYYGINSLDKYEIGKTYVVQSTYDGKEIKLYINGELQRTLQIEGTIGVPKSNTIVMLGSNPNGTKVEGNYYKGIIYTARIYNRALTESELNKNYNSDSKRYIGIIRKEAVKDAVIQTGNLKSTTGSLIYNFNNSYLNVERGILNVNKANMVAIENFGKVTLGKDGIINLSENNNTGILNYLGSTILDGSGTINANSSKYKQYGIYNYDYTVKEINGYTIFTNNSNSIAYYKCNGNEQTLNNFTFNGTGYSTYYSWGGTDNVFNIKNSTINSRIYNNYTGIINIDNSDMNTNGDPIYNNSSGKIIVNNSKISSNSSISNKGEMIISKSNINANGWSNTIQNYMKMQINDTIISNTGTGNGIYNGADSGTGENTIMTISGDTVVNVTDNNEHAIYNASGTLNINNVEATSVHDTIYNYNNYGIINIKSGKFTSTSNSPIANIAQGTITIGEKEENKDEQIPKDNIIMTGKTYGIYNPSGIVNYYDGVATASLNQSLYGSVSDTIEEYDLNVQKNEETETISLQIPSNYVAKIGENKFTTLQSAIDSINGTTETQIDLISDVRTINNVIIPETKNIKLNLNSYTIRAHKKNGYMTNNGTLSLTDLSEEKIGKIETDGVTAIENNGTLSIDNITIKSDLHLERLINNNGILNLLGGEISSYSYNYTYGEIINDKIEYSTITNNENAIFKMTGGTINKTYKGISLFNRGQATITGGTLKLTYRSDGYNQGSYRKMLYNASTGTLNVSNVTTLSGYVYSDASDTFIVNYGEAELKDIKTDLDIDNNGNLKLKNITSTNSLYNQKEVIISNSKFKNVRNSNDLSIMTIKDNSIIDNSDGTAISTGGTGTINIINSTINSARNEAIYNLGTGIVNIEDTIIESTNNIAIYNDVYNNTTGIVNVKNSTIKAKRYGIQNRNTGSINITGTTSVTSIENHGIYNDSTGTINIGEKDGNVSTETPIITGKTYGIYNSSNNNVFNFYDGVIKGETGAIYGKVNDIEQDYEIVSKTEDGVEIKYLAQLPVAKIVSTDKEYLTLQEAFDESESGDTIQMLRNVTTLSTSQSIAISEEKNVILDLNGYTMNSSTPKTFINNGTLKIVDSSEEKQGNLIGLGITIIENNNSLNIEEVKLSTLLTSPQVIDNKGTTIINNSTITTATTDNGTINNEENGILKITDSTIAKTERYGNNIKNSGTVTIDNTEFKFVYDYYSDYYNIYNLSTGNVIVNGGTYSNGRFIKNVGEATINDLIDTSGDYYDMRNYGGTLNLNNIDKSNSYGEVRNDTNNNIKGTINIKGGSYNYYINNYGDLNLSGTTIKVSSNNALNNYSTGIVNIEDTIIESTNNIAIYNDVYNNTTGIVNVKNSTIKAKRYGIQNRNTGSINITGTTSVTSIENHGIYNDSTGTINIGEKDGNVSTETPIITGKTYGIYNSSNNNVFNFYDGVIKGETGAIYGKVNDIEQDYEIVSKTEDGVEIKYLAQLPVAKIVSTDKEYLTLQEAFDESESGDTIQMLRNVTTLSTSQSIAISEEKNVILDLNGYTMNSSTPKTFINNGTLKIVDSSEEKQGNLIGLGITIIENNNSLNIEEVKLSTLLTSPQVIDNKGTTIINNSTITTATTDNGTINNEENGILKITDSTIAKTERYGNNIKNSGTVTIDNTEFKFVYDYYSDYYNIYNLSTGNVIVNGGTYSNGRFIKNVGEATINDLIDTSGDYYDMRNYGGTLNLNNIDKSNSYGEVRNDTNNNIKGTINIKGGSYNYYINNYGDLNLSGTTIKVSSNNALNNYSTGIVNIEDTTIESTNNIAIYNSSYGSEIAVVNIKNSTIKAKRYGIENQNTGAINVTGTTSVTSTENHGIYNESTGTITIGEKDGNVSVETPIITGKTYGIYNNNNNGIFNFYDGVIKGETGAIYGSVTEVEPGYKIVTNNVENLENATLILVGDDEKVAVLNGMNFTKLQDAINSASDSAESVITIYANITLDSNIVVPEGKNIKIYLNGYTITKGNYDFTGEGKVTLIEGTNTTNVLASIIENVKEVLNIDDIKKNIIIYEMDDGSKITSEKTYKLYKIVDNNKEEVKLKEEEIGKYNVENKEDEIRTVKGRIYINNLPKGNYELISNDNKKASFEITETGKLVGKIKENINESKPVIVSAIAELIITIQTGTTYINYILIIITLLSIIASLYLVQKKTNKKYLS